LSNSPLIEGTLGAGGLQGDGGGQGRRIRVWRGEGMAHDGEGTMLGWQPPKKQIKKKKTTNMRRGPSGFDVVGVFCGGGGEKGRRQ